MATQTKRSAHGVRVKVLPEGVEEYCERHTTALTELHERLLHETEERTTTAIFLVVGWKARFNLMLVRMTQPKVFSKSACFRLQRAVFSRLTADGRVYGLRT